MAYVPTGVTSNFIPGAGFLQHDTSYYYAVTSVQGSGESLPSADTWVVTSGTLSGISNLTISGVNTSSGVFYGGGAYLTPGGKLPSGVYSYGLAAWDGTTISYDGEGLTVPRILNFFDYDNTGSVIANNMDVVDLNFSGVNVLPFTRSFRDPALHLPSGILHIMPYQGTAYTSGSDVYVNYHMTDNNGKQLIDSGSFNTWRVASGLLSGQFFWDKSNLINSNSYCVSLSGVSGCLLQTPVKVLASGTMELWFKPSGIIDVNPNTLSVSGQRLSNALLQNQYLISDGSGIGLYLNALDKDHRHRLTFRYVTSTTTSGNLSTFLYTSNSVWRPDAWYHAAISWGSGIRLYLNGILNSSNSITGAPIAGYNVMIGANVSGLSENFNGQIKEFRYLSGTQATNFNVTSGTSGRVDTIVYTLPSGNFTRMRSFTPLYDVAIDPYGSGNANFYYSLDAGTTWTTMTSGTNWAEINTVNTMTDGTWTTFDARSAPSGFIYPCGIDVDPSGYVYVADPGYGTITKFDNSGKYIAQFAGFANVTGLCIGQSLGRLGVGAGTPYIYVTASGSKLSALNNNNGSLIATAAISVGRGVTSDPNGIIYACDTDTNGNNGIVKAFSSDLGTLRDTFNPPDVGSWQIPFDVAAGSGNTHGVFYVLESKAGIGGTPRNRFTSVPEDSTVTGYVINSGLASADSSMALDNTGFLYIADFVNSNILKVNQSGVIVSKFGTAGSGVSLFKNPGGIAVDNWNNIFISDTGNRRIVKLIPPSGIKFRGELIKLNTNFDDPLLSTMNWKYVGGGPTSGNQGISLQWFYPSSASSGVAIYRASGIQTTSGFPPVSMVALLQGAQTNYIDLNNQPFTSGAPVLGYNGTQMHHAVALSWTAVAGAASYSVYRTAASGNYSTRSLIASGINTTTYVDTVAVSGSPAVGIPPVYRHLADVSALATQYRDSEVVTGLNYGYKISAINSFGVESPLSTEVTIVAGDQTPPLAPSGLSFSSLVDTGIISWLNGNEADYAATEVYQLTNKGPNTINLTAVVTDANNQIFIAHDPSSGYNISGVILKFSKDRILLKSWGNAIPELGATMDTPVACHVSGNNVYVVDQKNSRVLQYDQQDNFIRQIGPTTSGSLTFSSSIVDVATDSANNIYVLDSGNFNIQKFNSAGTFVTTIGSGRFANFPVPSGGFNTPTSLCIDTNDNLYVLDSTAAIGAGYPLITKYNDVVINATASKNLGICNFRWSGQKGLANNGICADPSNTIFVTSDQVVGQEAIYFPVSVFNSMGVLSITFGTFSNVSGNFGSRALGIEADQVGNVFIKTNITNNYVNKYKIDGTYITTIGNKVGLAFDQFATNVGVYGLGVARSNIALDNTLWVPDPGNNAVKKFTNANFSGIFGSGIGNGYFAYSQGGAASAISPIQDIDVDTAGNVYVLEGYGSTVQKFDNNGTFLLKFGVPGTILGALSGTRGNYGNPGRDGAGKLIGKGGNRKLAVDSANNIWVLDGGNNRAQKFDSNGGYLANINTNVGGGVDEGVGGNNGMFVLPFDIDTDSSNRVFITDNFNLTVQRFSSTGAFQLSWGSGYAGTLANPYDPRGNSLPALSAQQNAADLFYPEGIFIDTNNNVYVGSDNLYIPNNYVAYKLYDTNGNFKAAPLNRDAALPTWNNSLSRFLTGDSSSYILVGENEQDGTMKLDFFNQGGTYLSTWGTFGYGLESDWTKVGDIRGNLFVRYVGPNNISQWKLRNYDFNLNYSSFSSPSLTGITSGLQYFSQAASGTYTDVNHYMHRYPNVQVFDTNLNIVIPSGIRHKSTDALTVTFDAAVQGTVICVA